MTHFAGTRVGNTRTRCNTILTGIVSTICVARVTRASTTLPVRYHDTIIITLSMFGTNIIRHSIFFTLRVAIATSKSTLAGCACRTSIVASAATSTRA